ncbi:MAG: methyltransferase domain-containing protein [Myxococcales bacterium]|nr:methyltransferase domain-containing protein [Myxococcales bacterium]
MSAWNTETAEWYAAKYGEYATNRLAADAVDVAPDAVIVDVGCGTGSALRRIAPRVPQGTLIGVDPVPRMLEIARERAAQDPGGHRIEFRAGPAEHLPIDDGLDHWEDKAVGLGEVVRVLRPGGRLVVVKDGGLPGGAEAKRAFLAELARSGFVVMKEEALAEGDVACTMWVCGVV